MQSYLNFVKRWPLFSQLSVAGIALVAGMWITNFAMLSVKKRERKLAAENAELTKEKQLWMSMYEVEARVAEPVKEALAQLSTDSRSLLLAGVKDQHGQITHSRKTISAGERKFSDDSASARDYARWKAALDMLHAERYVELAASSSRGPYFVYAYQVTRKGYDLADVIEKN